MAPLIEWMSPTTMGSFADAGAIKEKAIIEKKTSTNTNMLSIIDFLVISTPPSYGVKGLQQSRLSFFYNFSPPFSLFVQRKIHRNAVEIGTCFAPFQSGPHFLVTFTRQKFCH
jgi:hypothetical protein